MLSSLEIKNFKGIREGKISDLAQVNILVGRNNSGKSTILDALLLMRCAFAPIDYLDDFTPDQLLLRKIDRREKGPRESPDYGEIHHMLNTGSLITLFARFFDNAETVQEWDMSRLQVEYTGVGAHGVTASRPQHQPGRHKLDHLKNDPEWLSLVESIGEEDAGLIGFTHLVDPATLRFPFLERIWGRLFLDRRDRRLCDMINDVYSMNVEVFNQADFGRFNRITAGLPERGVAVDWLGDGLRYALNILALGMLLDGTILMVEQLETHQHPESLKKLTQTLFELAKKQNLQLFLTTHSWELMTYALESADQTGLGLAFHHLDLDTSGALKARAIPSPDAKLLMDIGHDPRRIYKYTGVK